jgi:hypothetical protein
LACEKRKSGREDAKSAHDIMNRTIRIELGADALVVPVQTPTTARIEYVLGDKGDIANVTFYLEGVSRDDITYIHFHNGKPGEDGPIIWTMPLTTWDLTYDGHQVVWAQWTLTRSDIENLRTGLVYCDIHTKQHPQGELRCQLRPPPE